MMNTKTLIISFFLLSTQLVSAQGDAKEIFLKATEALATENIEMAMAIDVTDDKGHIKSKELTVLMGKFGDEEKTKVIWQKPERARGTTIVITETSGETGIVEVYTPSNGKTRKLKATDANMKMMGTEFSMTNFANYDPSKLKFEMQKDTVVNGNQCHRIRVSGSGTKEISSAVLVIQKKSNFIIHATRYDESQKMISATVLNDYKKIEGEPSKMYPMHIATSDFENKKDIVIRISNVTIKKDLTQSAFSLQ